MLERYLEQTRLLVKIIPEIAKFNVFALKGGTAINLFYRDMPRISVDIDLVYLPIGDRSHSLEIINEVLDRITSNIKESDSQIRVQRTARVGNAETRILVNNGRVQVKIEISPVIRGTVYPPRVMSASDSATNLFGYFEMNVVAFEDLYGGKLHAALDRQHPRDLFDIKLLYENEGITNDLFRVFLVYVASSRRPIHELLEPGEIFINKLYDMEFSGMTRERVPENALIETRKKLHSDIRGRLSGDVANFLISLHDAEPDFNLIGLDNALNLPAVQWKLFNLRKLKARNPQKHTLQRDALVNLFH